MEIVGICARVSSEEQVSGQHLEKIREQGANCTNKLTPLKAIRVRCLDCQGGSPKGVRICEDQNCCFFIYRFGTNPNRKGIGGRKAVISQKEELE